MSLIMYFKGTGPGKSFPTLLANERFLTSVDDFMLNEERAVIKRFFTLITFIRFITKVDAFMI